MVPEKSKVQKFFDALYKGLKANGTSPKPTKLLLSFSIFCQGRQNRTTSTKKMQYLTFSRRKHLTLRIFLAQHLKVFEHEIKTIDRNEFENSKFNIFLYRYL